MVSGCGWSWELRLPPVSHYPLRVIAEDIVPYKINTATKIAVYTAVTARFCSHFVMIFTHQFVSLDMGPNSGISSLNTPEPWAREITIQ